ncbi:ABC transporter permease [Armatimonas rosea]|uniref:Simple sugar transport system permease protein n=1 Tax=Armatimonas rosea TaxID=685828 RepID=A0A7W9SLI4_ARMRO|nr:ABC transporter permease [Armatimonas rosea]MBB6048862.1 simple sugar transport system permease protein [Armatimonas rosea]
MRGHIFTAIVSALLLGGLAIAAIGQSPLAAYQALWEGSVGTPDAWGRTLGQATPLLLTGTAVAVGLAVGLFNIGAEGQMAVGGLVGAVVGATVPGVLAVPLGLLCGALVGAAWAWLPVWLKLKRGAHEVITAILLNYVARNVTRWLTTVPLKDPTGQAPQTAEVHATLPRLAAGHDVHAGLLLGLVAVATVAWALSRTVWGYETRLVGQNKDAARAAGVNVERVTLRAFLLSGALAGLAGAVVVLGVVPFHRFPADFYGIGYGFDGLAVALLAGSQAWAVLPAALLFGALGAGADQMSFATETPKQLAQVVQALLILGLSARFVWKKRRK